MKRYYYNNDDLLGANGAEAQLRGYECARLFGCAIRHLPYMHLIKQALKRMRSARLRTLLQMRFSTHATLTECARALNRTLGDTVTLYAMAIDEYERQYVRLAPRYGLRLYWGARHD